MEILVVSRSFKKKQIEQKKLRPLQHRAKTRSALISPPGRPLQRFPFFFSSKRRDTRLQGGWSSDVCSSDLAHLYFLFLMFFVVRTVFGTENRIAVAVVCLSWIPVVAASFLWGPLRFLLGW